MFCNTLLCGFIDFIIFPCADYDNQHVIVMTDKLVHDTQTGSTEFDF